MTDEIGRALLAAVRRSPDDWDSWRVLADWLAERGDVRGELIGLEHRLVTAPGLVNAELRQRADLLAQAHQAEWLAGWVPPAQARPSANFVGLDGSREPSRIQSHAKIGANEMMKSGCSDWK